MKIEIYKRELALMTNDDWLHIHNMYAKRVLDIPAGARAIVANGQVGFIENNSTKLIYFTL